MSTTRRSFLKMIAGVLVAGPVVVKAALARRELPAYRTVFNPNWKVMDFRPKKEIISDGRGGTIEFTNMPRLKPERFVPDPYSLCAIAAIHEMERQNPGKYLKPIADRE